MILNFRNFCQVLLRLLAELNGSLIDCGFVIQRQLAVTCEARVVELEGRGSVLQCADGVPFDLVVPPEILYLKGGAVGEIAADVPAPSDKGTEIVALNAVAVVEEAAAVGASFPVCARAAGVLLALVLAGLSDVALLAARLREPLRGLVAVAALGVPQISADDVRLGTSVDCLALRAYRILALLPRIICGAAHGLLVLPSCMWCTDCRSCP